VGRWGVGAMGKWGGRGGIHKSAPTVHPQLAVPCKALLHCIRCKQCQAVQAV
jgi:hypothetical protein